MRIHLIAVGQRMPDWVEAGYQAGEERKNQGGDQRVAVDGKGPGWNDPVGQRAIEQREPDGGENDSRDSSKEADQLAFQQSLGEDADS